MTRRIKRTSQYELTLSITDDDFANTPRTSQRNWLLNRVLKETVDDLEHLHEQAQSFLPGSGSTVTFDRSQGSLEDQEIMEDWQVPIMEHMARSVAESGGEILEVGFGRGVASSFIQAYKPRSHTIVECNDQIVEKFDVWNAQYSHRNIQLLHGMWQNCLDLTSKYDGILFHTYPLSEHEFVEHVVQGVTFAEHFFDAARALLKPGGRFTYLTNEVDSLSRAHQRLLFRSFSEFTLSVIGNLDIPDDTRDSLWSRQIVVISVTR